MPVLRAIRQRFDKEKPLAGLRMSACLHITSEYCEFGEDSQKPVVPTLACASNPLSTQDDVAASLVKHDGIPVYAIKGEDEHSYYRHIAAALQHQPHVTMDDAPTLVSAMIFIVLDRLDDVHTEVRNWAAKCFEEAKELVANVVAEHGGNHHRRHPAAGHGTRRRAQFPVIAVNDAQTKHFFDNRYGTGQSTIDGIIRATNISGPAGRGGRAATAGAARAWRCG